MKASAVIRINPVSASATARRMTLRFQIRGREASSPRSAMMAAANRSVNTARMPTISDGGSHATATLVAASLAEKQAHAPIMARTPRLLADELGIRRTPGSAAGHAHVPRQRRVFGTAVDDEVVALWLARDGPHDRRVEEIVALRRAQRRAQVGAVLLAETHEQRAGAGDAHAIAALAEVMGQRRDEAEEAAGLLDAHISCRPAGAVVAVAERIALRQARPHRRQRQILVDALLVDGDE